MSSCLRSLARLTLSWPWHGGGSAPFDSSSSSKSSSGRETRGGCRLLQPVPRVRCVQMASHRTSMTTPGPRGMRNHPTSKVTYVVRVVEWCQVGAHTFLSVSCASRFLKNAYTSPPTHTYLDECGIYNGTSERTRRCPGLGPSTRPVPRARPDVARSVPSPDDVCSPRGDAAADSRAHTSAHLELACPIAAYNHLRGVCTEESVAASPRVASGRARHALRLCGAQRACGEREKRREKHGGGTTERTREREGEGREWGGARVAPRRLSPPASGARTAAPV